MQASTGGILSPDRAPVVRRTASSLLAKFLPNQNIEHKMAVADRTLRSKPGISYAQSNSSASPESPSQDFVDLVGNDTEDDEDDDEIQYEVRKRSARTASWPRKSLALALYASANEILTAPVVSDRTAVRREIASVTNAKRDRFFIDKKDYFLPLLPANSNYVKKLVDQYEDLNLEEKATVPATISYKEIGEQPRGIKAIMKPYQLSGLSFMVYLHRNGLSGILGDEMGLGKTLQALSLIQYLKENEPISGREQRPFLVVCPLSVLSSWMAEARKWAPGLKVLRFHGPTKERDRLKRIAMGEIDMFGKLTSKQKAKLRTRRTATGKPVISLDSESEGEKEDVGVDLVVTTYDSYLAEQTWFKRAFVWRYVILDEGHKVKNDTSLISKGLQGLQSEYRLILTGTPLQNNLSELWALLHWLYKDVFTESTNELFRTSFDLSRGQFSKTVLDDSRRLLELIMLRRMKDSPGVDLNLPPKTEILLFVPLSPMQRFWYTRLITRADQALLDEIFRGARDKEQSALLNEENRLQAGPAKKSTPENLTLGGDEWKETANIIAQTIQREKESGEEVVKNSAWQKLMNLLMQLRKICNHPYQIPNAEPDPYESGDHIIRASGKFIVLEKLIDELVVKQKKKILIFSGFTRMLDLVEELLLLRGGDGTSFKSLRLDGGTARARRNLGIRMFNNITSDYRVMLISTRAGGLGINLATASDVVLLDQDWNPQITLQAEARAHRIGQTKPVTIYKLVSQGTVEEQMMGRIQKKLYLSAKVTEAMRDIHTKAGKTRKGPGGRVISADDDMPELNTGQLMSLIRRGTTVLSRPEVDINEMLSWDWETMVKKCKDQPADVKVNNGISDAVIDQEAEQKWLSEMERVESHVFEGKKLERKKDSVGLSAKNIAMEWEKADRRVGKNTTVMVDGFAINKESMLCKDWEAVPTMAGKDPRLAEPKRVKKAAINSQSHCQVCLDGGDLHLCQRCPRAYHFDCLESEFQSKARGSQFNCPQHQCNDCGQKTADAGGMLYRCRWCERAFCEDCMDWDETVLIGDTIIEYDVLSYPEQTLAFYVQCHVCTNHFIENPANRVMCDMLARQMQKEHDQMFGNADTLSRAGSMTDATTIETTGANTPLVIDDEIQIMQCKKRRIDGEDRTSTKSQKRAGDRLKSTSKRVKKIL